MTKQYSLAHIDDSVIVTMSVQHQLEPLGWKVRSFNSTIGVINDLMQNPPDIILLDVKLPDLDGDSYISVIRRSAKLKRVPILFYSSLTEEELQDLVESTEADGYLCKTGDGYDLDQKLRDWLAQHKL